MDNNWYVTYMMETRRRDDEVDYAERHRLVKLTDVSEIKFYQRWLVKLGVALVVLGSRLQNRYQSLAITTSATVMSESEVNPC